MDVHTHLGWFDGVTAYTSHNGRVYLGTHAGKLLIYEGGSLKKTEKVATSAISALALNGKDGFLATREVPVDRIWTVGQQVVILTSSKQVRCAYLGGVRNEQRFELPGKGIYINGIFPEETCFFATQFQGRIFKGAWETGETEQLFINDDAITAAAKFGNTFYFGGFDGYFAGLDASTFQTKYRFEGGETTFTSIGASEVYVAALDRDKCLKIWDVRKPSKMMQDCPMERAKKVSFVGDHFFLECRDRVQFWRGR